MMMTILILNSDKEWMSQFRAQCNWSKYGYKVIGCSDNGTTGMEMILRWMPDLVFICQKLSGLNGIEIVEKTKTHGLNTEFIFVEDEGSFALAQLAMRLGVREYLLKPIPLSDVEHALRVYTEIIQAKHNYDKEGSLILTRRLLRNSFMENFVSSFEHQEYSIEELNKYYHFSFREGLFRIALIQLRDLPKFAEEEFLPSVVVELRARFDPICYEMIPFIQGASRLTLIFNYDATLDINKKLAEIEEIIKTYLSERKCIATSYSVGIGKASTDANDLLDLLHSAERAAYYSITHIDNRTYYFDKLKFTDTPAELYKSQDIRDELEKYTEAMNFVKFREKLTETFKCVDKDTDPEVIVDISRAAIEAVATACDDNERARWNQSRKTLYRLMNSSSLNEVIDGLCQYAKDRLESAQKEKSYTKPVRDAIKYIKSNCAKPISLQNVADHVHLNASYLSLLFKKETEHNYMDYLTECRIDEAKKMLKDSNLSIAEICYNVGYTDKKHFSRLFIKKVGIRPTAYRMLH